MTANPLKGEAAFDHDGQQMLVRIDVDVLMQVEEATGMGVFEMERGLASLRVLAAMLQLGLAATGRAIARREAADLLMTNPAARAAVIMALNRALPDPNEEPATGDDADPA